MNDVKLRIASTADAAAILAIYAPYVKNTAITFEYDVPTMPDFINRIDSTLQKYPYLVAELNNQIVGYAYAGSFEERAAYNWSVETSIYIKDGLKKTGIGKKLYSTLERMLQAQNVLNMNASIAHPQNEDEYLTKNSIAFHQRMGFTLVGEFNNCGHKFNRWYNMIWMEKHIGAHIENPPEVTPFPEIRELICRQYDLS